MMETRRKKECDLKKIKILIASAKDVTSRCSYKVYSARPNTLVNSSECQQAYQVEMFDAIVIHINSNDHVLRGHRARQRRTAVVER